MPQDYVLIIFFFYFCLVGKSLLTFQLSSTLPKLGQKCQENSTNSNVIKGNIGISTGHRRKRALSPSVSGSDGNGASKKSEISLGKELVSSCDSVATKSSLDDQNVKRKNSPLMENVNVNRSIDEEHSNHPSTYKVNEFD